MGAVLFALSFQNADGDLPGFTTYQSSDSAAEDRFVAPMTRIYRQAFRSVFDQAMVFGGETKPAQTDGADIRLLAASVFRTSAALLIGDDMQDYLLIALVEIAPHDSGSAFDTLWKRRFATPEAKIALARALGLHGALAALSPAAHGAIGQTSKPLDFPVADREFPLLATFAFYVSGWLNSLRIERKQLSARLHAVSSIDLTTGVAIADQRLRILNQQRFYLTGDRSNDLTLRGFCNALVTKYALSSRNNRALELHRAFEHHLDNSAKLHGARQLGSVSNLVLILTVLSVPISVFSAIFAINLKSEALEKPFDLLSDYRVYVAFLIGGIVVGVPFLLLKIFDRIRLK